MATWSGFQTDLLNAAGLGASTMQQQFILDWNTAASTDCRNNPVDISRNVSGSTSCKRLTPARVARNYTSHSSAGGAFKGQLRSGNFPHLLAALETSNPYAYTDPQGVEADLNKWGSPKQAAYYAKNATGGTTAGSGAGAPHTHKGWESLRTSVNVHLPAALRNADRHAADALRQLAKAHKVRV